MQNEDWRDVTNEAQNVVAAYRAFVHASDALAALLPYDKDYVLRRSLPSCAERRRDGKSISEWLSDGREQIESDIAEYEETIRVQLEKERLLKRLSLNESEKKLLGIK